MRISQRTGVRTAHSGDISPLFGEADPLLIDYCFDRISMGTVICFFS
jgi:hypothetical protein